MTNRYLQQMHRGGRQRLPYLLITGLIVVLAALIGMAGSVSAHAEPERAEPAIDGVVPVAPEQVEIWFDEEVESEGTTIQVIGPDGIQVDLGDAQVDLQDPERRHVTVSLRPNLGPGTYTVQWVSASAEDGDQAQGGYVFRVASGSPVASPVASPVVPDEVADEAAETDVDVTPIAVTVGGPEEGDFDSQAFGISVAVGLVAAVAIFGFWRLVRPKNPKFG